MARSVQVVRNTPNTAASIGVILTKAGLTAAQFLADLDTGLQSFEVENSKQAQAKRGELVKEFLEAIKQYAPSLSASEVQYSIDRVVTAAQSRGLNDAAVRKVKSRHAALLKHYTLIDECESLRKNLDRIFASQDKRSERERVQAEWDSAVKDYAELLDRLDAIQSRFEELDRSEQAAKVLAE